jgi:hypothetical protein
MINDFIPLSPFLYLALELERSSYFIWDRKRNRTVHLLQTSSKRTIKGEILVDNRPHPTIANKKRYRYL